MKDREHAGAGWSAVREWLAGAAAVLALTGCGWIVCPWTGHWSIALFYLALVVLLALKLSRPAIIFVALLSGLLWNYLFIPPLFTLRIAHLQDALMFAVYLLVAAVMGHVTSRLRQREEEERRREERARTLYRLARALAESQDADGAARECLDIVAALFGVPTAYVPAGEDAHFSAAPHPAGAWALSPEDAAAAAWCHEHGGATGRFTTVLPESRGTFVPLVAAGRRFGVLAAKTCDRGRLDADDLALLRSVADQLAAALHRYDLARRAAQAQLAETSERLCRTLFGCVSHELKTPLAVIAAAVKALRGGALRAEDAAELLKDIEAAASRLQMRVEDLLDMSQLEAGGLQPEPSWCEVDELIEEACERNRASLGRHRLVVDIPEGLPVIRVDSGLLGHALSNLLLNASQHTPEGSTVRVSAAVGAGRLQLSVEDDGPGLSPEATGRVFEKFYRGPATRAGGTGLGLAIVSALMQALGGSAAAANRPGGGAVFTLSVPVETTSFVE